MVESEKLLSLMEEWRTEVIGGEEKRIRGEGNGGEENDKKYG